MTVFENIGNGTHLHPMLKAAVRAFIKLFVISTSGWEYVEACDRTYDAGEWSGPAWGRNWEDEHKRVLKLVARRFDISVTQLEEAVECWSHHEQECFMNVMFADPNSGVNYDAAMLDPEANR